MTVPVMSLGLPCASVRTSAMSSHNSKIKSPQGLKLRGWEFTAACVLHGDVSDFYFK
jgi:hypothetical protein